MFVDRYVCLYICMYVCMYVCIYVRTFVYIYVCYATPQRRFAPSFQGFIYDPITPWLGCHSLISLKFTMLLPIL